MVTRIPLYKYQIRTRGNWNKTSLNSDPEDNEGDETDLDIDNEEI